MSIDLEAELYRRFGHREFRPGQKRLIEAVLAGRDALGVMPTGGGKSLAFQLPAALMEGTALVISPLIALMKDQVDALRARGIPAAAYNSSLSHDERRSARDAFVAGRLRLLYMAPERMQQEGFLELLANARLSFLAIDEAHCISHWGHDFRPDYRRLGELRKLLRGPHRASDVPVIALTATATAQVQSDIVERLGMNAPERVITGFRRTNLAFEVRPCSGRADKLRCLRELLGKALADGGSAVVYAATRKNVERVSAELAREGGGFYHAGLADTERARVQDDFLSGKTRVLVATNAFGMGIDKADVRLVVHYDIPGSVEAYYQEAGRAGRDGKPARCALLFNYADVATQDFFIQNSAGEAAGGEDNPEYEKHLENQRALLKQLVRYAYASTCRQQLILGYFGDPEAREFEGCGLCDRCRPEDRVREPVSESLALAAKQALSAVARLNGRFGKTRICEILKGSESAALLAAGLQTQPTYGLLKDRSLATVRELVDLLSEGGYLKTSGLDYPVLCITPEGVQAMKGIQPVTLPRLPQSLLPRGGRAESRAAGGARRTSAEAAGSSGGDAPAQYDDFADADPTLLGVLKEFRREEARQRGMPAYVIFHDRTLLELASERPRELAELGEITGFGPKKLELYGEKVLALISAAPRPARSEEAAHGQGP